jgi:hypothetical protein
MAAVHPTRRTRSRVGGVALLALLLLALAPLLSRLQSQADPLAWVQVCTGAGLMQAQTLPDGDPMPNPAEHLLHGDGASPAVHQQPHALPAAVVVLNLPASAADGPPVAVETAAWHTPLWHRAQARAPPRAGSA